MHPCPLQKNRKKQLHTFFLRAEKKRQWDGEVEAEGSNKNRKERETGEWSSARREWPLELGHSGIDVMRSDAPGEREGERGRNGLAPLSASPSRPHTHTHAHIRSSHMLAVHWVNNTCAGVKIVLLVHREDKVPPPSLSLSVSLSVLFTA